MDPVSTIQVPQDGCSNEATEGICQRTPRIEPRQPLRELGSAIPTRQEKDGAGKEGCLAGENKHSST